MDILSIIWISSLVMAGITPLFMLILVVNRIIGDRIQRRRKLRSDELITRILIFLDDEGPDDAYLRSLRGRDRRLLGDLVGDLLRLVRGDNRSKLVGLLRRLGAVERQIVGLRTGNKRRKIAACANLAYFDDDRVTQALLTALDDDDFDVRMSAARALADLDKVPSIQVLIDKLDIRSGFRSKALSNLFRDLGQAALPELMLVASRPEANEQVKILAISAMGRIGDLAAVDVLVQLAHDSSLDVRAAVFRSLAMLSHPSAAEVLNEGLRDPAWQVRTQAAGCAGRIGAISAIPLLMRLLFGG